MFGYVRARGDILSAEARDGYQAAYCGVCRAMGKTCGQFSRLFLNYDFAFLAMVLAPDDIPCVSGCKGCLLHPVKGRPCCEEGRWLELAAAESVILTYWKLRDSVADSGFFKSLPARFLSVCLRPGYQRARKKCPDFDREVISLLDELEKLEQEGSPSIDRTADCFARILKATVPRTGEEGQTRALEQLLYHVGRWIYLIDGVDDLEKDKKSGNYNPVAARFPQWTEKDKDYLRGNLNHSLALAGAAFQLLKPNAWTPVVENILYSGLPGVTELVFAGEWREYKDRKGVAARE